MPLSTCTVAGHAGKLWICCGVLARHNLAPSVVGYADGCRDSARGRAGDHGRVDTHPADCSGATWRSERPLATRQRFVEEPGVVGAMDQFLGRRTGLVVDCLDSADQLAGAAIHAFVGVDVERAAVLIYAVDGAFLNA